MDLHKVLEERVANFVGKEDAVVFAMGYATNSCSLPALAGPVSLSLSSFGPRVEQERTLPKPSSPSPVVVCAHPGRVDHQRLAEPRVDRHGLSHFGSQDQDLQAQW
jgi:hypothetical protein